MKNLTIAMPYYESPEMLRTHLQYWSEYPEEIRDRVRVIIVDDGSPKYPAMDVLMGQKSNISIELYRVVENIPWNHGGARNLSMRFGDEQDWVLTCDIDLIFPAESAEKLLAKDLEKRCVYKPRRLAKNEAGEWKDAKRHPECFVMKRGMFWNIGGFDEDFTGYWNGTFTSWRMQMKRLVTRIESFDDVHFLDHCFLVKDAMVSEWGRRGSEYDVHNNPEMLFKRRQATRIYNPKNHLRFTWEQLI